MAGIWIVFVAPKLANVFGTDIHALVYSVALTGAMVMTAAGLLLDCLRAPILRLVFAWLALACIMTIGWLACYPTLDRAIGKNGSLLTYGFASLNASLTATTAGSLVLVGAFRLVARLRRPRAGHCAVCGYDLRGNVTGRCSECGMLTPASPQDAPAA